MGAVPVIKVLRESLAAARITGVMGIVNGTTNYILSAMAQSGAEYAPTLVRAQELGYAEADPTEDVTGKDAAAKMAILSSIAFHSRVNLGDVEHQGIESITDVDVAYGKALGLVPKLLGVAKLIEGRVNVRVYPCFIPAEHPLAGVSGAYNAVFLESDSFDNIMLFGPGAGGTPTASAVIGDVISIVNTAPGGYIRQLHLLQGPRLLPERRGGLALLPARAGGRRARRAGRHRRRVRRRGREHPVHAAERRRRRGAARAGAAPGARGRLLRRPRPHRGAARRAQPAERRAHRGLDGR